MIRLNKSLKKEIEIEKLSEGDVVIVEINLMGYSFIALDNVIRVTPTGRVRLKNFGLFNPNKKKNDKKLLQVTAELMEVLLQEKQRYQNGCELDFEYIDGKLSIIELNKVLTWQRSLFKKKLEEGGQN